MTLRTFIAIEIPDPQLDSVGRSLREIRVGLKNDSVRWIDPSSVHLTLKFLGDIEETHVGTISKVLDHAAQDLDGFVLEIKGFGCFPNSRQPRVVWLGINQRGDDLSTLHERLESELEQIGYAREQRAFHPHLTVGRVRKGLSRSDVSTVSNWARKVKLGVVGDFQVGGIALMRSDLRPTGAVYSRLHKARLTG